MIAFNYKRARIYFEHFNDRSLFIYTYVFSFTDSLQIFKMFPKN